MTDLFPLFLVAIFLGIFLFTATHFVLDAIRGANKLKEVKKIIEAGEREEKEKEKKKEANDYDANRGNDRYDYE